MLIPQAINHNDNQIWQNLKGLGLALAINEFHELHPGLFVVSTDSVHHSKVGWAELREAQQFI